MKSAQFHRMAWDYKRNTGVGKIHYEPLGIVAFYWVEGTPMEDVNFLDKDMISYYWQQHMQEFNVPLTHGCIIGRDLEVVLVKEQKYKESLQTVGQATGGLATRGAWTNAAPQSSEVVEGVIYGIEKLKLLIKVQGGIRYLAAPDGEWFPFDEDTPVVAYQRIKSLLGL